ncbi:uncharacterized protein LOC134691659 isoform X2 [Mytilus trossulus]|uniref:uncharacterized protein LOC134691659 isoform X2 n=1 Tax=Mytilus trossulus TaxID=6551 RepID=UPI0030051953
MSSHHHPIGCVDKIHKKHLKENFWRCIIILARLKQSFLIIFCNMYSLLGLFLLVLIVSPSFEINFSKHAGDEKNDIGQGPSLERRRRGLYPGGQEYAFFLHYFQAINKADQFKNSISAGNANWTKAFDTTYNVGYFKAIDKVTAYYALPANNGSATEKEKNKDDIKVSFDNHLYV